MNKTIAIRWLQVGAVVFFGGMISFIVYYSSLTLEKSRVESNFKLLASMQAAAIEERLSRLANHVQSIEQLQGASSEVSAAEFARFVQPFFESSQGAAAYFWAATEGDEAAAGFAVRLVEPMPAYGRLLSSDFLKKPDYAALLAAAREGGGAVAAPWPDAAQDEAAAARMLLLVPHFGTVDAPGSRPPLIGFAAAILNFDALVDDALSPVKATGVNLSLRDVTQPGRSILLYAPPTESEPIDEMAQSEDFSQPLMRFEKQMSLFGRTFEFTALLVADDLNGGHASVLPMLNFLIGLLATSALGGIVWMLRRKQAAAEEESAFRGLALQESEARFRRLFEESADANLLLEHGRFVECNKAALAMLGVEGVEDVYNKGILELSPEYQPDGRRSSERIAQMMAELEAKGSVLFEWEHLRADGTAFPVEIRLTAIAAGERHLCYVIWRDLAERRRLEKALRESEQVLRAAISAIDEAFVIFDPEDRLMLFNDKYREVYASSADLLVEGNSFEHIIRVGAERGQYSAAFGRIDAWVAERLAAHQSGNTTLEQRLDDGRWLRIVERKTPAGHIVGFRVDITALKQAQEAAEASSRAKSEFLANMSHEVRTPLNAVIGLTELLFDDTLTPRQASHLRKIHGASLALLDTLNDILDYSKVEAGHLVIENRPMQPAEVAQSAGELFAARLAEKNLAFALEIAPEMPSTVTGDPLRLSQVLNNLLSNAIKFSDGGEVRVQLAVAAAYADGWLLRFSVSDTGLGMNAEQLARIFQPFTQADSSITRNFGGTGLGLSICKRLVGLMGGDIGVLSEPGKGASFSFTVRVGLAAAAPEPAPAATLAASLPDAAGSPEWIAPANLLPLLAQISGYVQEQEVVPESCLLQLQQFAEADLPGGQLGTLLRQLDSFDHDAALSTIEKIRQLLTAAATRI